ISDPIYRELGISVFIYSKVFKNGKHWTLGSRHDWLEYFYQSQYVNPDVFNPNISSGYYIDLSLLNIPMIQITTAREEFNLDHWFNIIKKFDDFYEVFGFAAPRDNYKIITTYINNIDLLE